MCAVCAVYDYGKTLPNSFWSQETMKEYLRVLEAAKSFDEATGQADCEDPSKAQWLQEVKTQVENKE